MADKTVEEQQAAHDALVAQLEGEVVDGPGIEVV